MKIRFLRRGLFWGGVMAVFSMGWLLGRALAGSGWTLVVNGRPSPLPVRVFNNTYFIALADLARLPGWRVTVDLGARRISMTTLPTQQPPAKQTASRDNVKHPPENREKMPVATNLEVKANTGALTSGPPNNVRMTVQAALASMEDLRKLLADSTDPEPLKQKRDETLGIVQQAQNLLWSLPRTNTLRTDIQVALDDLQSQINLILATDQSQGGVLPWTHPTTQGLLLKYPDLHPCHITKGRDGLDVGCARKMLSDLFAEDYADIQRDLNQYQ